jgi:hypothetical protein
MTVSLAAGWVIAIVIVIALFSWLAAVLRADTHPGWKHQSKLPKYEVTGGAFQAQEGGRQLMPIPGERPVPTEEELARSGVPAQRAAAEEELARSRGIPAQRAGAKPGATATGGDRAEKPHLAAGSKLRLAAAHPARQAARQNSRAAAGCLVPASSSLGLEPGKSPIASAHRGNPGMIHLSGRLTRLSDA